MPPWERWAPARFRLSVSLPGSTSRAGARRSQGPVRILLPLIEEVTNQLGKASSVASPGVYDRLTKRFLGRYIIPNLQSHDRFR